VARSEDAAARGERLRAMMDKPVDTGEPSASVSDTTPQEAQTWDHIPAQQILVVEVEGETVGAVTVDTEEGRVLFSQETSPCPTCGQDWTRGDRLDGEIKIVWPPHYKT
jgi:hypothetical protein